MILKEGDLVKGRYELLSFKGRGSYGEVWLARDEFLNMEVALKIYVSLDQRGIDEFRSEYLMTFSLNHPNLLRISYFDFLDRRPFLVMPYCPTSSESLIGAISETDIWKFIRDVSSGLAYLHSKNIIHRDIKPDNILRDTQGDFLISDFGITLKMRSTLRKASAREITDSKETAGSIAYMGPELFSSDPTPVMATDIWALGATLYELMEGELPFFGQGGAMLRSGAESPSIPGNWSDALKSTVSACLSRDTWERPKAEDLFKYADAYIKDSASIAPWAENWERLKQEAARKRREEEERKKRLEEERAAEEERKRLEAEQRRLAEERRRMEEESARKEREKREREEQARKKAEEERRRREEEERRRREEEKSRKEREKREQEELDRKKAEEERRRREEEERQRQEAERLRREEEKRQREEERLRREEEKARAALEKRKQKELALKERAARRAARPPRKTRVVIAAVILGIAIIAYGAYYYSKPQDTVIDDPQVGDISEKTSNPILVESVNLEKSHLSMRPGDQVALTVQILPLDAEDKTISWSSDNPGVATVSSSGNVVAKSSGSAVITVKTQDGNKTSSCTVSVIEDEPHTDPLEEAIRKNDWSTVERLSNAGNSKAKQSLSDHYYSSAKANLSGDENAQERSHKYAVKLYNLGYVERAKEIVDSLDGMGFYDFNYKEITKPKW